MATKNGRTPIREGVTRILTPPKARVKPVIPEYSFKIENYLGYLNLSILDKDRETIFTFEPNTNPVEMSCGVKEVYGLPLNGDFKEICKAFPKTWKKIVKEGMTVLFDRIMAYDKAAFLILSNNTDTAYSKINEVFNEICSQTGLRVSPKTKNKIKIWVY